MQHSHTVREAGISSWRQALPAADGEPAGGDGVMAAQDPTWGRRMANDRRDLTDCPSRQDVLATEDRHLEAPMQTIRAILPVLVLLFLASSASAQDMPDLVLITLDLHWTVPVYGAVSLSGSEEWRNGVGFTDTTKRDRERWHVMNTVLPSEWTNLGAPLQPQFALVLDLDLPHDELEIRVPLNGQLINPVVRPGDYPINDSVFVQGVFGRSFAESGHISVVTVPELAIMRKFTKHIGGRQLHAALNPTLQRITAWGAAKVLGAKSDGVYITLPSVRLEVQEWCSGIVSMKWLLLLGVGLAIVGSRRFSMASKIMLILTAPLIALEINVLRVAGVGAGIEWFGLASRGAIKEWLGWGAMVFGVVQVIGLGWLVGRRASRPSVIATILRPSRRLASASARGAFWGSES
jgi:exosortase/archaeosortase family protein